MIGDRRPAGLPSATAPGRADAADIMAALAEVPDPELPVVSIVDLGMIGAVDSSSGHIRVEILPTFVGCPAIERIHDAVRDRLGALAGGAKIEVVTAWSPPWTTDRITVSGRVRLAAAGIAPPSEPVEPASGPPAPGRSLLVALERPVACPYCGSTRTVLENAFGPTPCRTIRFCTGCRQPFEAVKPV